MAPYSLYSALLLTISLWALVRNSALQNEKGAIWTGAVEFSWVTLHLIRPGRGHWLVPSPTDIPGLASLLADIDMG